MPPYLFKPGEKVDTAAYYKVLRWTVLPWLRTTYPDRTIHGPKMVLYTIRPRRYKISAALTCPTSGQPTCGPAQAQT
ncbi:Uncharacterized protein FKW44_011321 [Caligus rogercresseyi]|uniref:Uncharacterized protein n=1 Tax=Caligus rogercresseyi TaxID=217165 RepID=A0A7T8HJ10_CALRO|nr:Uncharacterized protein FKW44_011321 [Caligus rogercresseyi]